jgi:hypothetical protein
MKRKFDEYLQNEMLRGDIKNIFYQWDMDKILSDVPKWNAPARWLCIYVIANDCSFRTLHAWVGCNSDVFTRLDQHNGKIPGGPAATRKAAVRFFLLLVRTYLILCAGLLENHHVLRDSSIPQF